MAGNLVHFEFPADDAGRATSFWNSLFGWDFEEFQGSGYHITQTPTPGGALQGRQEGQTASPCTSTPTTSRRPQRR